MIAMVIAVAALGAVVASVPLAVATLTAARTFARAADRYRIVAIGFALVVSVAPLSLAIAIWRSAAPPAYSSPVASALSTFSLPLLVVLATVSSVLVLGLIGDVVRLRRVKRRAVPLGTLAVRGARLGTSAKVGTPTAIGYLHPAVVVPEGFAALVDPAEWAAVVAHECAHLSRWDDWAKALQSAVVRAGWWLPGLWMLSRALDLERELASDERAAITSGARRYAACLLRLATDRWDDAVAPGLWSRRSHVAIRVERLVRPISAPGPIARAVTLGAGTAAALAVVTTAVLAVPGLAPSHGAPPPVAQLSRPAHAHQLHVALRVRHPVTHAAGSSVGFTAAQPNANASSRSVAVVVVRPVLAERPAAAARRSPQRPAARPAPVEVIAFVARRPRCATCFGPMRSPDVPIASPSPSFGATPAEAAIAAPDATGGPVDLGSGIVWYRLPPRGVSGP
jgi:beta-lactamase regulating signal transducer with metallopeptidase domain